MPKAVPPKEVPIAGATVLPAGQLFVVNGKVVVNPIAQTVSRASRQCRRNDAHNVLCSGSMGCVPRYGLPIFDKF
jgi:hypothetical protein